jgi:hypothetical protein
MHQRLSIALASALLVTPPGLASAIEGEANADGNISVRQPVRTAYANPSVYRASASQSASSRCSADALPAAERGRMQTEYQRRVQTDGKASADAWAREQARQFRQRLVAQGVCGPSEKDRERTTSAERSAGKRIVRDQDGRPCKRTRLENRNIANLGGGAMTMVLVPVCAD